ncbi:protein kinase domain-containing protein [Candidatus Viridilinea mediisalina]|uniref:non-specific serine/threonine protein kinase n=1 Tax=Candidatus Viridilinea mediisalina TaxID=2024553 RepID=A0A2A6RH75_9CHLR|nr:protein kinase [Candidatus Viridilinea mediisalina]PDW02372.1 protein kinase [Candidatus Viridilinea mediisalina]
MQAQDQQSIPSPPLELRNYRLTEQLHQEELATVYRATHLTLDRPVQMHLLRRHDWISVSRFQLAARLSAHVSHPNLVPVIDAGHDEKLGDYLVTPQLDAQLLSTLLADGPLPAMLAIRITTQVAAALDYLHSQAVFHRDVQPANILVGAEGVTYLANLSLAASPDTPDLSSIDEADYLTPYSAPEQKLAQGEAGTALDIYSLGAVVYHMLSGEVPPTPGSDLPSLARRDPGLAPADRVVARMLAPQPTMRFTSAGAAVAALRQALRDQIDHATADMEESRWEATAEWLDNPFETAIGATLDDRFRDFVGGSRARADELHRRDVIRRLLNRWSQKGYFRRRALGQLIIPEQIVSYNVYFYELRTLYEQRLPPETRVRPQAPTDRDDNPRPPDLWEVTLPVELAFESLEERTEVLPNSIQVNNCPECMGAKYVRCKDCKGSGLLEQERKVSNPDRTTGKESVPSICPTCVGSSKQQCPQCKGTGGIAEEQVFRWSRRAKIFENSDDIDDLPALALKKRRQPVFSGTIDPYEGRWHSVAPVAELLRTVIQEAGKDTRIVAAELNIEGVPITEMDVLLDEKPHRLYIVGFDKEWIGDWSLLNSERVILAVIVVILALLFVLALILG